MCCSGVKTEMNYRNFKTVLTLTFWLDFDLLGAFGTIHAVIQPHSESQSAAVGCFWNMNAVREVCVQTTRCVVLRTNAFCTSGA